MRSTMRDRSTAEGSDRNSTMNHAQVTMMAAPATSTGQTHAGVAACTRRSSVVCTAGESSRTSLRDEGEELLFVEDRNLELVRLLELGTCSWPGHDVVGL